MLNFKGLTFQYKNTKKDVLKDVDFQIEKGECVLVTGASGNGKSTLIHLINGLIPNLYEGEIQGEILLEGKSLTGKDPTEISRDIGYVSQDPRGQFFTTNTTSELVFAMENFGFDTATMQNNLREMIDLLGLSKLLDQNIFTISSGERQKIAIGCSLSLKPKILVLDEPSSNLDFGATTKLTNLIKRLKDRGYTIIIAEHRLYYLKDLIDKVLLVENQGVTVCSVDNLVKITTSKLRKFSIFDRKLDSRDRIFSSEPLINLTNIHYQNVLSGINLTVNKGDIIGLIGKNGAGKTTLLRLLTTIIQPTEGTIQNYKQQHPFLVMQDMDYQFFTESVSSELLLGNEQTSIEERTVLLNHLGLGELQKQLPFDLSGGQKQRLLIGIASLSNVNTLLFDEPTSGLDYVSMKKVNSVLKPLAQHSAMIIATHDVEFLYQMCNRIIYLDNGRIKNDFAFNEKTKHLVKDIFMEMVE